MQNWWKFVYIFCILRVKTAPCFIECFSSICVIVACQLCWNSTFTRPGVLQGRAMGTIQVTEDCVFCLLLFQVHLLGQNHVDCKRCQMKEMEEATISAFQVDLSW